MIEEEYLNKIILGDALMVLRSLPADIVDLGGTSPPYNKGENKRGWLVTNGKKVPTDSDNRHLASGQPTSGLPTLG